MKAGIDNKIGIVIFLLVAGAQLAIGQTPSTIGPADKALQGEAKAKYPGLALQAKEVADATITKNFEKLVDLTHPRVISMAGGKERMIAGLKKADEQMQAETGAELSGVTFGEMQQEAKIGTEVFVVVPMTILMKIGPAKFTGESSIVGISSDNGVSWTFVNGVNQVRFAQMFPAVGDKIKIKEDGPPKRID